METRSIDKQKYISDLYNKLSDEFIKNINKDEVDEMRKAYLKYLHDEYDDYFYNYTSHFKTSEDEETEIKYATYTCTTKERVCMINCSSDEKHAKLFPDPYYIELENLSLEIFSIAQDKVHGKKYDSQISKQDYINELQQLYNAVTDKQFEYSARRLLSEALLDLEYIFWEEEHRPILGIFKKKCKVFSMRLRSYL